MGEELKYENTHIYLYIRQQEKRRKALKCGKGERKSRTDISDACFRKTRNHSLAIGVPNSSSSVMVIKRGSDPCEEVPLSFRSNKICLSFSMLSIIN